MAPERPLAMVPATSPPPSSSGAEKVICCMKNPATDEADAARDADIVLSVNSAQDAAEALRHARRACAQARCGPISTQAPPS